MGENTFSNIDLQVPEGIFPLRADETDKNMKH